MFLILTNNTLSFILNTFTEQKSGQCRKKLNANI